MATHVIHDIPPHKGGWFTDGRHALYAGWVLGMLSASDRIEWIVVVDEDGNYTPYLDVLLGDEPLRLSIPYPPSDWSLTSPVLAHE